MYKNPRAVCGFIYAHAASLS